MVVSVVQFVKFSSVWPVCLFGQLFGRRSEVLLMSASCWPLDSMWQVASGGAFGKLREEVGQRRIIVGEIARSRLAVQMRDR